MVFPRPHILLLSDLSLGLILEYAVVKGNKTLVMQNKAGVFFLMCLYVGVRGRCSIVQGKAVLSGARQITEVCYLCLGNVFEMTVKCF